MFEEILWVISIAGKRNYSANQNHLFSSHGKIPKVKKLFCQQSE